MARANHEDAVQALEENISQRLANPGRKGERYTASYFHNAWLFHSSVYGPYRWGIFYDHRFYGYTLTKRWPLALAKVRVSPWADLKEYEAWRDAQDKLPLPIIPDGYHPIQTKYWRTTYAQLNPFAGMPRCPVCDDMSGLLFKVEDEHGGAVALYKFFCARCATEFERRETRD